jgi:Mrp family chromosome partitioning ATPase/capsular polysaccharide biosynthesis protein
MELMTGQNSESKMHKHLHHADGYASIIKEDHNSDNGRKYSVTDTHKVFRGLRRHVLLILIMTALGVGGVLGITYFLNKTYTAQSYVLYQEESGSNKTLMGNYTLNKLSLPTMMEMMRLPMQFKSAQSIFGLDLTVDQMMDMTKIESPPGRSNLIRIVTQGRNASLVVELANSLASVIVKHSEDLNRRQLQEAYDYFKMQREIAGETLSQNSKEIAEFKQQNPSFEQDTGNSTLIEGASRARAGYQGAYLSYNSLLVEYENLKREADKVPDHIVKYSLDGSPFKERLTQTEMALLDARTKYASDNPKIKLLESSLRELRNMLNEQRIDDSKGKVFEKNPFKEQLSVELMRLQGKLRSQQQLKEDLEASVIAIEKGLETLPKEQMQFVKLMQVKKSAEEEAKELDLALRSTLLYLSLGKGDVDLYQSADVAEPITSRWDKWLSLFPILGAFIGLGLGIGIAVGLEMSDHRICTAKQIDLLYKVKCIQTIPEISGLMKKDIEEQTLFYIRDLVDQFECLNDGETPKSIGFTSSLNGEGKSCLAYYLAKYYATRLGKKTVVIEFDYHLNEFLREDLIPCATVEKYLRGETDLSHIVEQGKPDCIKTAFDPSMKELLKSDRMAQLWKDLSEKYDVIVIDTPAIVEDDYALNLVNWVDLCVFVIGSAVVKRDHVDASFRELERRGITPCGIVLNRVVAAYIDDVRIRAERKNLSKRLWKKVFKK